MAPENTQLTTMVMQAPYWWEVDEHMKANWLGALWKYYHRRHVVIAWQYF